MTPVPDRGESRDFTWRDGERIVRFGRGAAAGAGELLGPGAYTLLSTPRARAQAPAVVGAATQVLDVGPGRVDELAGALRGAIEHELIVALGGGRVIDTAKALAAADPPRRVAAIPTTLSAAEMTRVHRHAAGVAETTPRVRPAIVINDPAVCASQRDAELAASAANALAHALEGPLTVLASPVPSLAAARAAALIAGAFDGESEPRRDDLALAALLSGYAIDSCAYALHHVMSQTLVRLAGVGHGQANACLLPHTLAALHRRAGERLTAVAAGIPGGPVALAGTLASLAGALSLRELGVERDALASLAAAAAGRAELALVPPAPDEAELMAIYEAAW